jgi:5'-nucleotidase
VAVAVRNAAVPIRIGDPAAGCAGNRLAGQVSLTANLAVVFGGNQISGVARIDGNGPGNTVLKANTFYGPLGCSGNAPAPASAGQPNTGGARTGQCAAL